MTSTMTLKAAKAITGSLGNPSKMPGLSYGLPAAKAEFVPTVCKDRGLPVPLQYGCAVGALMADIPGTTCHGCYATKANYRYSSVQIAQTERVVGVYHPMWKEAMIRLIGHYVPANDPYFRWHDSGDLLGLWHLLLIVDIANALPWVQFWLPTREAAIIAEYRKLHGAFPANLIVRVSAIKVDGQPSRAASHTSTVHADKAANGHVCPAPTQGNACGDCRACWNHDVANVSYHVH